MIAEPSGQLNQVSLLPCDHCSLFWIWAFTFPIVSDVLTFSVIVFRLFSSFTKTCVDAAW